MACRYFEEEEVEVLLTVFARFQRCFLLSPLVSTLPI